MQKMPRFLPMLALVGPLMACSTAAQQQAIAIHDGLQTAVGQAKTCEQQLQSRPELAPLRPHFTLETAADLADTSLPTPAEAELIKLYMTGYAECQTTFRAQVAANEPAAAQALDQLLFDMNSLAADLITRKITWADAARRWHDIKSKDGSAISAAHQATMRTLAAQHQQELAERREKFDRLSAALLNAAVIINATQPHYAPSHSCQGVVDPGGNFTANCD